MEIQISLFRRKNATRSSINSLLSYWFRSVAVPKCIIKKITSLTSKFFYHNGELGKLHMVSWSKSVKLSFLEIRAVRVCFLQMFSTNENMAKSQTAKTIIHDPSSSHVARLGASHREWRNFMSSKVADMYDKTIPRELLRNPELEDEEMDIRMIFKDIERLGSSTLTWQERKKLENKNVAALGGKPTKSHRMPLSVAKPMMKNKKRKEEKKMNEEKLLGVFSKRKSNSTAEKRRPEDKVLRATEGHFSKGVLNVKHLLEPISAKRDEGPSKASKGKRKKGNGKKKSKGKRKGR